MHKYCQYCHPVKRKSHVFLYLSYLFEKVEQLLQPLLNIFPFNLALFNSFWFKILTIFEKIGLLKSSDEPVKSQFRNRSLVFFNYAKSNGFDVKALRVFRKNLNLFVIKYNNKRYYYREMPLEIFHKDGIVDHKHKVKLKLSENGLPVARVRSLPI